MIVSRDQATGSSRNPKRILNEAGIDRRDTLLWSAVPWNGHPPGARNRPVSRREIAEGLALPRRCFTC